MLLRSSVDSALSGDRITLPQSMLENLLRNSGYSDFSKTPLTFRLKAGQRHGYGSVREFTAEEGHICLSPWLAKHLELDADGEPGDVSVELVQLSRGVFVQLLPLVSLASVNVDLRALLESFLRQNYATLTLNSELYVGQLKFKVAEVRSEKSEGSDAIPDDAILITDTELSLDILPFFSLDGTSHPVTASIISLPFQANGQAVYSSTVSRGTYVYLRLENRHSSLTFTVKSDSGQADLFVSVTNERPLLQDCLLFSVDDYAEKTVVYDSFPLKEQFPYVYIAVYGFGPGEKIDFALTVLPSSASAGTLTSEKSRIETANSKQCENCHSWISVHSFDTHFAFCTRNNYRCDQCGTVMQKSMKPEHWHCSLCSKHGFSEFNKRKHEGYFHTLMTCPCGIELFLEDYVRHRNSDCPKRLIVCRYCNLLVESEGLSRLPRDLLAIGPPMTVHESDCGSRTMTCRKCGKDIQIRDVQVHMQVHEMEKRHKPLPFHVCANQCCSNPVDTKNGLDLCAKCFSPFWNPSIDPGNQKLLHRLKTRYETQLYSGCGNPWCINKHCKSSAYFAGISGSNVPETEAALVQLCAAREFNFCVDENTGILRKIANDVLLPMGYALEWSIHALKLTKAKVAWYGDDSDSDDEQAVRAPPKTPEELRQQWISLATTWLAENV